MHRCHCPKVPMQLTCQPEGGHPLELGLLQPLPHPPEGLPAGLELAPGLGVAQQVGQGALRAAQHPLGEDGLRDAVALELGCDPLRHFLGVDLVELRGAPAGGARGGGGGGGGRAAGSQEGPPVRLSVVAGVVHAVQVGHEGSRRPGQVLLPAPAAQHGLEAAPGAEHLVVGPVPVQALRAHGGQALAHGRHLLVGPVEAVEGRQPALVAQEAEAAPAPVRLPLVRVELVGDGGDGRQRLQRGQRGVGAAQGGRGRVAGHAHGVVQRHGQLVPVVLAARAVQQRGHAGDHGGLRGPQAQPPALRLLGLLLLLLQVVRVRVVVVVVVAQQLVLMPPQAALHAHLRVHAERVQLLGEASVGAVGSLHSVHGPPRRRGGVGGLPLRGWGSSCRSAPPSDHRRCCSAGPAPLLLPMSAPLLLPSLLPVRPGAVQSGL
ncbi:hypothetical protein NDU88_005994 [Pleurodeles waltl]|uniref:Uncharacterized protein n=1 Tax=Pleurodeles waltl TaxID=8319 RepID=A0AAV7WDE9_PLEWA|nr:hypothetical protein NDU88_005994 [Pleurodeles waltl]